MASSVFLKHGLTLDSKLHQEVLSSLNINHCGELCSEGSSLIQGHRKESRYLESGIEDKDIAELIGNTHFRIRGNVLAIASGLASDRITDLIGYSTGLYNPDGEYRPYISFGISGFTLSAADRVLPWILNNIGLSNNLSPMPLWGVPLAVTYDSFSGSMINAFFGEEFRKENPILTATLRTLNSWAMYRFTGTLLYSAYYSAEMAPLRAVIGHVSSRATAVFAESAIARLGTQVATRAGGYAAGVATEAGLAGSGVLSGNFILIASVIVTYLAVKAADSISFHYGRAFNEGSDRKNFQNYFNEISGIALGYIDRPDIKLPDQHQKHQYRHSNLENQTKNLYALFNSRLKDLPHLSDELGIPSEKLKQISNLTVKEVFKFYGVIKITCDSCYELNTQVVLGVLRHIILQGSQTKKRIEINNDGNIEAGLGSFRASYEIRSIEIYSNEPTISYIDLPIPQTDGIIELNQFYQKAIQSGRYQPYTNLFKNKNLNPLEQEFHHFIWQLQTQDYPALKGRKLIPLFFCQGQPSPILFYILVELHKANAIPPARLERLKYGEKLAEALTNEDYEAWNDYIFAWNNDERAIDIANLVGDSFNRFLTSREPRERKINIETFKLLLTHNAKATQKVRTDKYRAELANTQHQLHYFGLGIIHDEKLLLEFVGIDIDQVDHRTSITIDRACTSIRKENPDLELPQDNDDKLELINLVELKAITIKEVDQAMQYGRYGEANRLLDCIEELGFHPTNPDIISRRNLISQKINRVKKALANQGYDEENFDQNLRRFTVDTALSFSTHPYGQNDAASNSEIKAAFGEDYLVLLPYINLASEVELSDFDPYDIAYAIHHGSTKKIRQIAFSTWMKNMTSEYARRFGGNLKVDANSEIYRERVISFLENSGTLDILSKMSHVESDVYDYEIWYKTRSYAIIDELNLWDHLQINPDRIVYPILGKIILCCSPNFSGQIEVSHVMMWAEASNMINSFLEKKTYFTPQEKNLLKTIATMMKQHQKENYRYLGEASSSLEERMTLVAPNSDFKEYQTGWGYVPLTQQGYARFVHDPNNLFQKIIRIIDGKTSDDISDVISFSR